MNYIRGRQSGGRGRARLITKGVVRPGRGEASAILDQPPLTLPVSISEALAEDRDDRL